MQSIFQVPSFVAATSTILLALQSDAVADQLENASRFGNTTLCTLGFHMLRWSPIYRQAEGTGTIRCTNGQRMNVSLAAFGGGITAGNARIRNGVGIFTEVWDINELIGDYRGASGQSGATRPARPNVITRGHVSLTLTRTRAGWNLGVTGGNFTIQRAGDVP